VQGNWFDLKYEKIPYFCFDCGRLVHPAEGCQAEKDDTEQWGEWLRASLGRSHKPPPRARLSMSSGSYNFSRSVESDPRGRGGVTIRDLPPRINLTFEQSQSNLSRTGGRDQRREEEDVTIPGKFNSSGAYDQRAGKAHVEQDQRKKPGTFIHRQRPDSNALVADKKHLPQGNRSNKHTKQIWV
jgi:hypothetical protein